MEENVPLEVVAEDSADARWARYLELRMETHRRFVEGLRTAGVDPEVLGLMQPPEVVRCRHHAGEEDCPARCMYVFGEMFVEARLVDESEMVDQILEDL